MPANLRKTAPVLATHCRPEPGADGPSWLTLIAHAKDSVWSVDLFRVELILLRSHWVMLVMDVFTRRISGDLCQSCQFATHRLEGLFSALVTNRKQPRNTKESRKPSGKITND